MRPLPRCPGLPLRLAVVEEVTAATARKEEAVTVAAVLQRQHGTSTRARWAREGDGSCHREGYPLSPYLTSRHLCRRARPPEEACHRLG